MAKTWIETHAGQACDIQTFVGDKGTPQLYTAGSHPLQATALGDTVRVPARDHRSKRTRFRMEARAHHLASPQASKT